jgi:hypothetical protein
MATLRDRGCWTCGTTAERLVHVDKDMWALVKVDEANETLDLAHMLKVYVATCTACGTVTLLNTSTGGDIRTIDRS